MILLVVHTKNNFSNVNAFVQSVNEMISGNISLLVVDDSSENQSIKANSELHFTLGKKIHIHKHNWQLLRDQLRSVPELKSHARFIDSLELGTKKWNTGNARSIGYIIASMLRPEKIFFFDDDMIFDRELDMETLPESSLLAFKLKGSPDFSRLEWIQLFIKTQDSNAKILSSYVEKVFQKCGASQSQQLLLMFTDLSRGETEGEQILCPAREEMSGGSYGIISSLLAEAHFPNCYEEDWIWFHEIKTSGFEETYINYHVVHDAGIKHILDQDALLREEIGKIQNEVIRIYKEPSPKNIQKILFSRKETLEKILLKLESLEKNTQVNDIIQKLRDLTTKLDLIDCDRLSGKLHAYYEKNKEWRQIITALKQITLVVPSKIIAYSPHSDDVFLSAHDLLAQSYVKKEIYTIFSISNYTVFDEQLDKETVTSIRKKEDFKAAQNICATQKYLDYQDAPLRGETDYLDAEINDSSRKLIKQIKQKLALIDMSDSLMLFPLGTSPHIDHKILHQAVKDMKGIYYDESYDYTLKIPSTEFVVEGKKLLPFYKKVKNFQEKVELAKKIYSSQIDDEQEDTIRNIADVCGGERFWKQADNEVYLL